MWCPDTLTCSQTYHVFPGEVVQVQTLTLTRVQRSKSLFFQVYPSLFIHETKRKGWSESERQREGEESPSMLPLMWKNQISFLIGPLMENTWHIMSSDALSAASSSVFFCLLFVCAIHAHAAFVLSTCVCKIGGEWDNMTQIKLAGGLDKENISNHSMLLLNCSPWEVIIPCRARGSTAVHTHFIQRLTLRSHSRSN